jgi:hypothetical protein
VAQGAYYPVQMTGMKRLLVVAIGATMATVACGTTATDATDPLLTSENGAASGTAAQPAVANAAAAPRPAYRDVTIPAGTMLPLSLTSTVASDTSAVEDAVTAALTRAITIDGWDVLPAGATLDGHVTNVDGSARVKGRAIIAFRFTSVTTGGEQYDVQATPLSHVAPAAKGEDATKIGGGAVTGVVLDTKGQEMRLAPGADVSTKLTAPLTVRVRVS